MANQEPMHVYPVPDGGTNALCPPPPDSASPVNAPSEACPGNNVSASPTPSAGSNQPSI